MAKLTFELYKFVFPYVIAKERSDCGNLNPSRDTIYAIRDTQYDIRIHYKAKLIEKRTPNGAGGQL